MKRLTLLALATVCVVAACDDANDPFGATQPVVVDLYTVYALTGTPAAYPSALNTFFRRPVRVDGSANFDVAFDIDTDGKVLVYPVDLVVASLAGRQRVGLRKVTEPFDSVLIAPAGTYTQDSVATLVPGEVLVIESVRQGGADVCQFSLRPNIYSKIAIDSVRTPSRTIFVKAAMNPNCGFRSFEPGVPTR